MRTKMIKNQAMLLLLENFAKYSQSSGYCQFAFQLFVLWKKFILEFSFFSPVYFKNAHNKGSNHNFAKFSLVFVLLVMVVTNVSADDENWFYESEEVRINLQVMTDLEILPLSDKYIIEKVVTELSFFPRPDYRQEVLSLETPVTPKKVNDNLEFTWYKPKDKKIKLYVDSEIKTKNQYVKITKKVHFPLQNLPPEVKLYVQETELIDYSNWKIKNLANTLSEGQDDEYKVVFNIAKWVKDNIEYNLSTVTADASLEASWVLNNRQGVCDELTNLFIAMLRSVGIPAKFVSGYSYTNSDLFANPWGPHGWAEVYFPEYGWVPFDVTYGEFGFIDATHIKLKESIDSDKTSTRYEWHGKDVDLRVKPLEFKAVVLEKGSKVEKNVKINAHILGETVDIGSYNLLQVDIENTRDHYVPVELLTSKTDGIEVVEGIKYVILEPKEKRELLWKIRVNDNLDKNYMYTYFINVYTVLNETDMTEFKVKKDSTYFSDKDINEIIEVNDKNNGKEFTRKLDLHCNSEKEEYYNDEEPLIFCTVVNNGNTPLEGVEVCIKDDCSKQTLLISEEKKLEFKLENMPEGNQNVNIIAKNKEVSAYATLELSILDKPDVDIVILSAPEKVNIKDNFKLDFKIKKNSRSVPSDVRVEIVSNDNVESWKLDKLSSDQTFILQIQPFDLYNKENEITIKVTYYDEKGNLFSEQASAVIGLKDLTIEEEILLFFKNPGARGLSIAIIGISIFVALMLFIMGWKTLLKHHKKKK